MHSRRALAESCLGRLPHMSLHWFRNSLCLLAAGAAIASTPAFADNMVTNGGFETGDLTGWTTTDSSNVFAQPAGCGEGGTYCNAHTGTYFAALGTIRFDGTLSQQITDVAGQSYNFSFWLASDGGTPNDFSASFNGSQLLSLNDIPAGDPNSYVYTQYSYEVTGTGLDTITFGERNDPGYLALDDVSVSTAVTPEPSSLALLGTGVLGALGAVRRRVSR